MDAIVPPATDDPRVPRTAEDVWTWMCHGYSRFLFMVRWYPNDGIRVPTRLHDYGYTADERIMMLCIYRNTSERRWGHEHIREDSDVLARADLREHHAGR